MLLPPTHFNVTSVTMKRKGPSCLIAQKQNEKQQQGVPSPIPQLDGSYDDIVEPAKEDPKCQLAKGGYSC